MKSYLIILLLLLTSGGLAHVEHRCNHDEISTNSGEMPALIVQELPRKGESTWQAYTVSAEPEWKPIRILFFAEDLENPDKFCTKAGDIRPTFTAPGETANCSEQDVITEQKKNTLRNDLVPKALRLHSERLMVKPVNGAIMLPEFNAGFCSTFTTPQGHKENGVTGGDMILYVAAGPTMGAVAAWAGACSRGDDHRPVIGFANFGPHAIEDSRESIRIAAHEIAHVLGFDFITMRRKQMYVRRTIRGDDRYVVTTASTVQKTRLHYNCDAAEGMELENEGGQGTADSHWERRNAKDELMSGMSSYSGYYSALTMAFFEDTGFYKANWGMEENMEWGKNAGCSFLTGKCVTNGVSNFPDMFCAEDTAKLSCTTDRRGLGQCQLAKYFTALPVDNQYFKDTNKGGRQSLLTDYCPILSSPINGMCHDGYGIPGNRFGPSSMCLKGESLTIDDFEPGDICAEVKCDNNKVFVRYENDDKWHECMDGGMIKPKGRFTGGHILCPRYIDVCVGERVNNAV